MFCRTNNDDINNSVDANKKHLLRVLRHSMDFRNAFKCPGNLSMFACVAYS